MLYDNTRIAVKEITGDGERKPTEAFSGLQSHYLFAAKFGRPGKGNDKGNVEGLVGYARRNFMVPVPNADNRLSFRGWSEDGVDCRAWKLTIGGDAAPSRSFGAPARARFARKRAFLSCRHRNMLASA